MTKNISAHGKITYCNDCNKYLRGTGKIKNKFKVPLCGYCQSKRHQSCI